MGQVAKNLEIEARRCSQLIIWTDCDREGENIGWEIEQVSWNRLHKFLADWIVDLQRSGPANSSVSCKIFRCAETRSISGH